MATNSPEEHIQDVAEAVADSESTAELQASLFMDFIFNGDFSAGLKDAALEAGMIEHAFRPQDMARAVSENGVNGLKARFLAELIASGFYRPGEDATERDMRRLLGYESPIQDPISSYESQHSLPEDRSHWDPQG